MYDSVRVRDLQRGHPFRSVSESFEKAFACHWGIEDEFYAFVELWSNFVVQLTIGARQPIRTPAVRISQPDKVYVV